MIELVLKTETETRKFRLLALLAAAAALFSGRHQMPTVELVSFIVLYLAYIMLLTPVILPRVRTAKVVYGLVGVDAVALGWALHLAGLGSALFILLPLFIIYYAIFFGYTSSLASATAFSLAYTGVAFSRGEAQDWGATLAYQVPLLYLVAIFSGYLSRRRLEERREKEELQELFRVESQAKELLEVARGMEQAWEPRAVVEAIASHSSSLVGFSDCVVGLFEDGNLVGKGGTVDPSQFSHFGADGQATRLALEEGRAVAADALEDAASLPGWAREAGALSLIVVPLITRGEKVGLLYFFDRRRLKPPTEVMALAENYGELTANAIAGARFHQATETRVKELLRQLGETIHHLERLRSARRQPEIVVGELRIDGVKEKAFLAGKEVKLSPTEFELLYTLADNAGQPVNHQTLLRRVWGRESGGTNVVDVSIHRLRRKLGEETSPRYILTVRGRGYMLAAQ